MERSKSIHRTDEQLKEMLDEPGTWVVHGHGDRVFGVGGSLRRAIDRASNYAQSGAVIVAIARVPPNRIFVFHDQMVRLIAAIREADLCVSVDADLVNS